MSKLNRGDTVYLKIGRDQQGLKGGEELSFLALMPVWPDTMERGVYVMDSMGNYFAIDAHDLTTQKPVANQKIVIVAEGKTTKAMRYVDNKLADVAFAKCSPDDEYDFDIGALLALVRLTGVTDKAHLHQEKDKPEPSYREGDYVRVVKDNVGHGFPIGSIVQLHDWHTDCGGYWKGTGYTTHTHKIEDCYCIPEDEVEFVSSCTGDTRTDDNDEWIEF